MTADSGFFQIYLQTVQKCIDIVLTLKQGLKVKLIHKKIKQKSRATVPFKTKIPYLDYTTTLMAEIVSCKL